MTLPFSLKINDKPTLFPEKILSSLRHLVLDEYIRSFLGSKYYSGVNITTQPPKIHTIRKDASDRWEAGKDIHMVINNRQKTRLQFAPVVKCVSVQTIDITKTEFHRGVFIEGRQLSVEKVMQLAINDGFDSVEAFWDWFGGETFNPTYFHGKIIHWTEKRY